MTHSNPPTTDNHTSPRMNVISLFSGVGFQEMGITVPFNLIHWCEKDKKTSEIFKLLHNVSDDTNLGDITQVQQSDLRIPEEGIHLLTSTFPCQSFSNQGKKEGFNCDKNGNMFHHSCRMIEYVSPKVVVFENVKNILNKKFNSTEIITNRMDELGYECHYKVLNSIHYGVPQSRDRWFMVCFRKDMEVSDFTFPEPIPLTRCVRDIIDFTDTERKCDSDMIPYFDSSYHREFRSRNNLKKVFDGYQDKYFKNGFGKHRIYSIEGCSPTILKNDCIHFLEVGGKLTSIERCRLMGMKDDDYHLLRSNGVSTRMFSHITGNGVVVDVFRHLFNSIRPYLDLE